MATVPLSGTNISLYRGIPWNNDYKHTRWFETLADQLNWFASQTIIHHESSYNFQRAEGKGAFVRINKSVDELWNCNYLSFQNADYAKVFYGFVTSIEHVQKGTCNVYFEIDIVQTWRWDMDIKPCFVVREHCPLWNADGSPVINTIDEGLNYGSEYDTVYSNNIQPMGGLKWLVVISKKLIHDTAAGIVPTVIGTPQPLAVYLLPFADDDTSPLIHFESAAYPDTLLVKPSTLLKGLYLSEDAINNIVSIYVTDWCGISVKDVNYQTMNMTLSNNNDEINPVSFTVGTDTYKMLWVQSIHQFRTADFYAGEKYFGYKTVKESKLLMYPYTQLILEDFKGNHASFKNEYISTTSITLTVKGSMGTSNKVSYGIQDYNNTSSTFKIDRTDEFSLINNEPNDVPIITDLLGAFLQGNRNSLMNQKNSILFNGVMGTVGSLANGAVSAGMGSPVGVATSGLGMVKGAGNTVLQLQGMEAKIQDISNVPPSISKMGSNTSYTVGNGYDGVYLIKKQIKDEYIKKLEDYFNMYGYKKNEVKIPNLHTRTKWNYVQTLGCVIRASINNEDLEELESVFDNGITLWHVDDIGNYYLDNGVIA